MYGRNFQCKNVFMLLKDWSHVYLYRQIISMNFRDVFILYVQALTSNFISQTTWSYAIIKHFYFLPSKISILYVYMSLWPYFQRDTFFQNDFNQTLTFNYKQFCHFVQEVNGIWYLRSLIIHVNVESCQISLTSYIKWWNSE